MHTHAPDAADFTSQGSVIIVLVHFFPFQKFAIINFILELVYSEEIIVLSISPHQAG